MIFQKDGESRLQYLARALQEYMAEHGEGTVEYDETTCDGMCLADDIIAEVGSVDDWPD
ncbi:MAG: hypothetical protein ABW134_11870 [Candidatus Thiodiazotropha endolucinida]